jgi:hypothetical protein
MQGGKNWFLPKEMNANRFFWDSHWLEIWSNHFYPSMGPNGGSVAMDSEFTVVYRESHISAKSLHVQNLIWFGYIARISQWGGGAQFPRSNYFFLQGRVGADHLYKLPSEKSQGPLPPHMSPPR